MEKPDDKTTNNRRDMRIIRPEQTKCGWSDCCGGNPAACWQPGQEAERAAFEAEIKRSAESYAR
jgi:hypothetical protein